jgi:amidophosphoribosyltransferase
MTHVYRRCQGAYTAVALITGHGMFAFRDPHGIRPAVLGSKENNGKMEYMVASESVALDTLNFKKVRDLQPGEVIYINKKGVLHSKICASAAKIAPCIFEHVYLARPDSFMDGISVYRSRLRMGEKLASKIKRVWPQHDIDVVIPIPDTSTTCAMELAQHLQCKLRHGFIKNRYIGRTFIMPGQAIRKKSVRQKLNAIKLEFKDKNVLLVDDSIVRGTTSHQIVEMAREAGANNVYFASAAPPVKYPNVYGIDMPSVNELIAHNKTEEEVAQAIGADKMIYQDLSDLISSCQEGNPEIKHFETSIFDGCYVTGNINEAYLNRLESERNEASKKEDLPSEDHTSLHDDECFIELHNENSI